jgi:hypothetical protein
MKCTEKDCEKEAVKTYVGYDKISVDLCEEHYNMWTTAKARKVKSKRSWLAWYTMYLAGKFAAMLWVLTTLPLIEAAWIALPIILLQSVELLTFPLMLRKYVELGEE